MTYITLASLVNGLDNSLEGNGTIKATSNHSKEVGYSFKTLKLSTFSRIHSL